MAIRKAVLDMLGFGCGSCAYAIEHLGRKLKGVEDIRVDLAAREVRVTYDDEQLDAPAELSALVTRIGHEIKLRETPA